LVRNTTKVYGIWDDHDYGLDNGGKSMPAKHLMRQLYLEFLDERKDSPRWNRSGIYESYYLDADKKIKLILLDNRWSLDEEK
jgi:alkaline phosphatase D